MNTAALGFSKALALALEHMKPLGIENIELANSIDRVAALDLFALVEAPSVDSSLKDGYAVTYPDVAGATPENPICLNLAGHLDAGGIHTITLEPGNCVRVLTGARIPAGADAVVSEEFAKHEGNTIFFMNDIKPGQNILHRGRDVQSRTCIIQQGEKITPGIAGLIAAAGHSIVPVFRNPVVAIIGTGDEIVMPGEPLDEGQLYASNIITLNTWCKKYQMKTLMKVVPDNLDALTSTLKTLCVHADAVITSGGAWTGDRDLVARTLEGLGWREYFHQVRMGPGKAVGFGMLDNKPVFILPGGPPSNMIGFLEIALPGLLVMSGHTGSGLPRIHAGLAADLEGPNRDWTYFFFGSLEEQGEYPVFHPLKGSSRLRDMAVADAIAILPEEQEKLKKGSVISVQVLK